jgi:response regulator RpfG family c-di-GMP phosphodiesterase
MYKVLVCDDKSAEIDETIKELGKIERSAGIDDSQRLDIISVDKLDVETVELYIECHNPDIIIMDLCDVTIEPPKKHWVGANIIRRLKENKAKEIPIIIWTQMDQEPYREATYGIRNGAADIVFKPRSKERGQSRIDKYNDLYQRINAALEGSNRKKAERDAELEKQEKERTREHKLKLTRNVAAALASVLITGISLVTSLIENDGSFSLAALIVAIVMGGLAWLNLLVPSIIYKESPKPD